MANNIDESTTKLSKTDEVKKKQGPTTISLSPFSINLEFILKAQGSHFTASYRRKTHTEQGSDAISPLGKFPIFKTGAKS